MGKLQFELNALQLYDICNQLHVRFTGWLVDMEKENQSENSLEVKIGPENILNHDNQEIVDGAIAANIQTFGGCGLGAVVLLNDNPTKPDESDAKIKDEGIFEIKL